jgi:hypothetical protein
MQQHLHFLKKEQKRKGALGLACLLMLIAFPSCLSQKRCSFTGEDGGCVFRGPELTNPRFEVDGLPLPRGGTLWMAAGAVITARWDTYTLELDWKGEGCRDEAGNYLGPNDSCQRCNLCIGSMACDREPDHSWGFPENEDSPTVVAYEGFVQSVEPAVIVEPRFFSGCPGQTPDQFSPSTNALYQILQPRVSGAEVIPLSSRTELVSLKVFTIQQGTGQTNTYPLEHYVTEPGTPPTVWYRWTIGPGPDFQDVFNGVLIGQVRILTGRPGMDPVTGRFRLEDARPVRPSSIIFLRDFVEHDPRDPADVLSHPDQNDQVCYADVSFLDGSIELPRCRRSAGAPTPSGTPPLFTATPAHYGEGLLTWFAEFKASEGADFDPTTPSPDEVPPGAVLAIEFTIKKPS